MSIIISIVNQEIDLGKLVTKLCVKFIWQKFMAKVIWNIRKIKKLRPGLESSKVL